MKMPQYPDGRFVYGSHQVWKTRDRFRVFQHRDNPGLVLFSRNGRLRVSIG